MGPIRCAGASQTVKGMYIHGVKGIYMNHAFQQRTAASAPNVRQLMLE